MDQLLQVNPKDIAAIAFKANIRKLVSPEETVKLMEKAIEYDLEGADFYDKINAKMDTAAAARYAGNDVKAERIMSQIKSIFDSAEPPNVLGDRPRRLFLNQIEMAEALEDLGRWDEAFSHYNDMVKIAQKPQNRPLADPHEDRMLYSGLSRCLHQLGHYEQAISNGQAALRYGRQYAGAHKLVAMPQRAL